MNMIADALGAVRSNSQSSNCGNTPAAHRLLIGRHPGNGAERRHDGRVAIDRSDARWCSDGSEVGCENGEPVRIAFTLDCCDSEAISWAAADGIASGDIRGLMIERSKPASGWRTDAGARRVAVGSRFALTPRARARHWPARSVWRR